MEEPIWVRWAYTHDAAQVRLQIFHWTSEKICPSVSEICAVAYGQAHMGEMGKMSMTLQLQV